MSDRDMDTLVKQVEALAQAFLVLSGTLHRKGVLDQQNVQAQIRIRADQLAQADWNPVVVEQMHCLADELLRDYFYQQGRSHDEIEQLLAEVKTRTHND